MDKIAIKIILNLYSNNDLIKMIAIREKYNYNHRFNIFLKENNSIINSEIPDYWKKRYINLLKKQFNICI